MIEEIYASVKVIDGALKLWDRIRSLLPRGDNEAAALMLEMQDKLLEAKKEALALKQENIAIKTEIDEIKSFASQKENYVLKPVSPGVRAYVPEKMADEPENAPWYCPACFEEGKKALFQFNRREGFMPVYACQRCKSEVMTEPQD